mgnify:CR=1 FL=1
MPHPVLTRMLSERVRLGSQSVSRASLTIAADCVLETLQILAFFAKSSSSWALAALTTPSDPSSLFSVIYNRTCLAQILGDAVAANQSSSTRIGANVAEDARSDLPLANEEDVLCLGLAILVNGFKSLAAAGSVCA